MREISLATVYHPEHIDNDWVLVDHPTTRPLQDGSPALGWEGDARLAVYLHKPSKTFVLWRLEATGEYMPISHYGLENELTPASINATIRDLIRTDSRRGFDPGAAVLEQVAKTEAADAAAWKERVSATADKLLFGLSQSHLPGVDVSYPRNLLGG